MRVELHKGTLDFKGMTDQQARTVVFALMEYRDSLLESVDESEAKAKDDRTSNEAKTRYENGMFLFETLATIDSILFDVLENYTKDDTYKAAVIERLGVV